MLKKLLPSLVGLLLSTQATAQARPIGLACDELKAQVEAKIRASGVMRFSVSVVDVAASAPGRVVGQCERGTRKLVYRQDPAAEAPAPARRQRDADILTECKDGTVTRGGNCGR